MRRLRVAVLIFLVAAPILFLLGMGWYAIWERGWTFWAWWPITGCFALAAVLAAYWYRQRDRIHPIDFTPPVHGTERDKEAWKLVEARAQNAVRTDLNRLGTPQFYLDTAQELALELARFYNPKTSDPIGSLTVPEILAVIELAAHDLAELVDKYVPAGHLLTIDHWRKARRAQDWYASASNLYWLAFALWSPLETGARYAASQAGITRPWQQIQQNLLAWFCAAYVQRVGHYLIEVHSGRLRVGASRYRELVEAGASSAAPGSAAGQVTITLLGQVKAGKSSLINALLGERRAGTDVLPLTDAVTRYELDLADVPMRLVLLDTPGYGQAGPGAQQRKAAQEAARKSDLLLLVLHARNAARQADREALDALREWYAEHPDFKMPPVVAVLTHIDLLSPALEWAPPYDWQQPQRTKEKQIADAVAAVHEQLGDAVGYVAPVCVAEGKVYGVDEWLLPAIVSLLDEARGVGLVRCLRVEGDAHKVRKVFAQLLEAGKQAYKKGAWPAL